MSHLRGKGLIGAVRAVKLVGGGKDGSDGHTGKKRQSIKDSKRDSSELPVPKEGEIYYRTVRSYPSIPEIPEEPSITITKNLEQFGKDLASTLKRAQAERKDNESRDSNSPTHPDRPEYGRAASIAVSVGDARRKEQRFLIWPEWSDADINAEKWDIAQKGKEKDKGKSPVVQHFFDDPEGKIELPTSLKVDHWKRPQDFITEKTPTIVDPDAMNRFDLMSANEYCHESELMRWITCQITALWHSCAVKLPPDGVEAGVPTDGEYAYMWRPWEHIYAINKVSPKTFNTPVYNPHGKYVVKLYWMGCWRKVVIDDTMPFDDDDHPLLPSTTREYELWPMLLTKALVKVACLDYSGGSGCSEFGDFSVISCLTGWLPEAIPLQYGHQNEVWNLLKTSLLEWKLPEPDREKTASDEAALDGAAAQDGNAKEESSVKEGSKSSDKADGKKEKGKDKEKKDDKKDKKDKKGDDKTKERSMVQDEQPLPDHPEIIVFASYSGPPKYPVRVSVLGEMANASERLRQSGISHMYPHPVRITQTRSCPLEPPPPPEVIPNWKLIRPRKKKTTPTDEPVEPEIEKPIQCLEITSPFINYKVSSVPIPSNIHRPKSSLSRGGARTPSAAVKSIEETDENAPEESDKPKPVAPPAEEKPVVDELTPKVSEELSKEPSDVKVKPTSASSRKKQSLSPVKRSDDKCSESGDRKSARDRKRSTSVKESKLSVDQKSKSGSVSAVPVDSLTSLPTDITEGNESTAEDSPTEQTKDMKVHAKTENIWMDFGDFTKCFKTLYIYHKPGTYLCNQKFSDLKTTQPTSSSRDRRSAPNTAVNLSSSTPSNHSVTPRGHSNAHSVALGPPALDDRSPHYLFVDNLKPTEIVVSFSAVSKWNDAAGPPGREESRANIKHKDRDSKMADAATVESISLLDGGTESKEKEVLQPGLLVAEPHSWKSLVTGQPLLKLRTTATRAAVLSLPEGRHVLKFHMQGPLGYHVHLVSTVNFVFGDEEKVMAELTKESCRFIDNANQVVTSLGKTIASFHDEVAFKQAFAEYENTHCPYKDNKTISKQHHNKVYIDALYQTLKRCLAETQLLTPEMAFAWRAFNYDCTTENPLGLQLGMSRPATALASDRGSASKRGNAQKGRQPQQENKLEHWQNREITADEHVAAIKLQKGWKGYYARKIKEARTPGTDLNMRTQEQLKKAWEALEGNMEETGRVLFRSLFKGDPDLMPHYPFYKDEWNKISYADYSGTHPDQQMNSWFIVFREIFYVTEEMLCVPKLYVPLPTCMLRVVNNDTGEEIPRVFQKVAPYVYKRNKRGYTFVAEARTTDHPLMANRWRMRFIGALSPLPAPSKNEVNASFHTRELRDYYIPNEKKIIFRYSVKVLEDHLVSLQMMTSKSDVYIKLQVLDHEEEIISAVGKGHVVLPAYVFQKDQPNSAEDENKRSSSRQSKKGNTSQHNMAKKRSNSAVQDTQFSRSSTRQSTHSAEDTDLEDVTKPHKYIIQAQVMRNSWPLSESSWAFVQMLKEMEKNELKVAYKERPLSAAKAEKAPAASKAKDKGGKGKGGKGDKDKGSRPPSQQFDITKPNWTLRVVSDGSAADDIEIKKDTERADEIRAMKKAWEDAEPGRAAKALQSRLSYLKTHTIQVQPDDEEPAEAPAEAGTDGDGTASPAPTALEATEAENEVLLHEPPAPPPPKEILQPLDITPFVVQTTDSPRLKDAEEIERQMQEKQAEIANYRAYRERVEAWREQDRISRNQAKIKQLDMCEKMQAAVDAAREAVNKPREAFRQRFLEAERKRLEEIAAQEAALLASQEKAPSPKGRKSAKGKKSAGKKKK